MVLPTAAVSGPVLVKASIGLPTTVEPQARGAAMTMAQEVIRPSCWALRQTLMLRDSPGCMSLRRQINTSPCDFGRRLAADVARPRRDLVHDHHVTGATEGGRIEFVTEFLANRDLRRHLNGHPHQIR